MTLLRTGAALARACHLGPTLAVTTFAVALAAGAVAGPARAAAVGAAVLTGQLSVGWSNDWIDAGRDLAVGRRDKPVVAGSLQPGTLRTAALVALVACVPLSLALGRWAAAVHLVAVGGAWAYNAGLKSTAWSWAPYAVSFGLLPGVATFAAAGAAPPWWLVSAGALLGVGAHLANALPDLEDDAATGVRGLPHRWGRTRSGVAAAMILLTGSAVAVVAPPGAPTAVVWAGGAVALVVAVGAVALGLARPTSRLPFTGAMLVAGIDVVLLVGAVGVVGVVGAVGVVGVVGASA